MRALHALRLALALWVCAGWAQATSVGAARGNAGDCNGCHTGGKFRPDLSLIGNADFTVPRGGRTQLMLTIRTQPGHSIGFDTAALEALAALSSTSPKLKVDQGRLVHRQPLLEPSGRYEIPMTLSVSARAACDSKVTLRAWVLEADRDKSPAGDRGTMTETTLRVACGKPKAAAKKAS